MQTGANLSSFVISLDLEQAWGREPDRIGSREHAAFLGGREAIPRILDLAADHEIAITWATVGLLFFADRDEMLDHLPAIRPNYRQPRLCAYSRIGEVGRNEREDPLHFGRSLVRRIGECPRQEIAGHTFSHYYALEDGGDAAAFAADLAAAERAAALLGVTLSSIVFPRNQVNGAYLPICRKAGYQSFRGVQFGTVHSGRARGSDRVGHRVRRLTEAYLPMQARRRPDRPKLANGLVDVPASHFLRPARVNLSAFDLLQRARIRGGMRSAARQGGTYHLWWHPQNFGHDIASNLRVLRAIFEDYRRLSEMHGMTSRTMGEVAGLCRHRCEARA